MRIHLIRHGETEWNALRRVQGQMESKLNEQGRQQAAALRESLNQIPFTDIYCSSSVRTRETAGILFEHRESDIQYRDGLREIFLGPWEGNMYADLETTHPEDLNHFWNEPHLFALTGAESFFDLQTRGINALKEIYLAASGNEVAIVSHGAIIKSILSYFEDRHLSQLWHPPKMHNCAHSQIEIDSDGHGQILVYANEEYRQQDAVGKKITDVASVAR